jgi:cellulose biosynthesis protein BcsQ
MRAVISVANVAARSGKTTVAVNLAAEFSARGIRTLLVDADPQARATPSSSSRVKLSARSRTSCSPRRSAKHPARQASVMSSLP